MNIDRGKYTAALFIDLKKAFDTVDYEILLAKLNFYGLDGKELNWFKSYLENRRQYRKVNGKVSKTEVVNCGVPQGSCLGSLLFLVYINDLPNCLEKSNVSMYADDYGKRKSPKSDKPSFSQKNRVYLQKNRV